MTGGYKNPIQTGSGGTGDIVGPASATDNAIARYDGTTGKLLQNSSVLIDDSNNLTGVGNITSVAGGITISTATNGALTLDPGGSGKTTVNAGSGGVDITTDAGNSDITITPHGTGDVIISSANLITPALGTPASGVMTNMTGLPVAGIADGTDGELITWDASGNAATVAVGTATHVLTSNGAGAAPTFQAPGGGGGVSDAFSAYRNAAATFPNSATILVFDVEKFDDDSNFSTSTGKYTVPTTGNYYFNTQINCSGGYTALDRFNLQIFVNTTLTLANQIISTSGSTFGFGMSLSGVLDLTATDTVEVRIQNVSGARGNVSVGAAYNTYFEGFKIN